MNIQTSAKNRINTVLAIFVVLNIVGDIGNVILWHANPSSQLSIVPVTTNSVTTNCSYLYSLLKDAGTTLAVASTILVIVAVIYAIALFGLVKKQKWGAILVIVISVVNRIFAVLLYEFNAAFTIWAIWTIVLVVVAYLDYRKLSASPPAASSQTFTVANV